jgi:hypothetical protein
LVSSAPTAQAEPLDLKTLIAAHDQSVKSVHSFVVEIEISIISGDAPEQPNSRYKWWHQGAEYRVFQKLFDATDPKKVAGVSDSVLRASGGRILDGYDPDNPPRLDPLAPQVAVGRIAPPPPDPTASAPDTRLYLLRAVADPTGVFTLAELSERASASRMIHSPGGGRTDYEIELTLKRTHRIRIDPTKNFAITRVESHNPSDPAEFNAVETTSWQDFGNGVHLPTASKFIGQKGGPLLTSNVTCRYSLVNKPIPDAELEVKFPDQLLVGEFPSGKVMISDGAGGYRETFASFSDYQTWRDQTRKETEGLAPTRPTWTRSLAIGAVLLLATCGVLLWRRARAKV